MCCGSILSDPSRSQLVSELSGSSYNMPKDLVSLQSVDEINRIIEDANVPVESFTTLDGQPEVGGSMDADDEDFDLENEIDYSGDHSAHI
ncbi:hypothetical protein Tco_0662622 [Tanacetum coccineum]